MLKRGNSKLKSNKPLKKSSGLKSTKSVNKIGKKSKQWIEARKEVVEHFEEIGLPVLCEAQLEGCTRTMFLTFAHSRRRRNIENAEQLKEIALLCSTCHSIVDGWKPEHTEYYIKQLIDKRNKND